MDDSTRLGYPDLASPDPLTRPKRGRIGRHRLDLSIIPGCLRLEAAPVRLELIVVNPLTSADAATAPTTEPRRSRILIIDDNQDLAQSLARLLTMLGHETDVAHDGPEGIETARTLRPDVILLDIGLPRLDGYYVARALRQEGFRDTLIIAISGYGQEEDRRRSLEAGMNHHLTKPVDIRTISELITQLG